MEVNAKAKHIFENDDKVKEHKLTHKGEVIFTGTEDQCWMKLQRVQPQSAHHATTYEGYKVEPTGNLMDDPKIKVTVVKDVKWTDTTILFEYRGKQFKIHKNAAYGYGTFNAGQTITVDSAYAYPAE